MSLTLMILINAVLDIALLTGLAWVMRLPFRGTTTRPTELGSPQRETEEIRIAA